MEAKTDLSEKDHDFNQNLIKSSYCLEQLCNMVNQLEKNDSVKFLELNQIDPHVKSDINVKLTLNKYTTQIEPEKDVTKDKCESLVTTYEDIMSFLRILENDMQANNAANETNMLLSCQNSNRYDSQNDKILCCQQQDDLKTIKLQIEEKNSVIECLKDQLRSERKVACDKMASQKRCHISKMRELESKYKAIIKRHQKFVECLIAEKTNLVEKCDSLVRQRKQIEEKIQRDLKVIAERHSIELQRVKENMAASEKIRRERWVETKTLKIKEMTVKGLEPEMHSMIEQHQQEIQELRRAHIQELQETESRAMRKSNQQLEQLRIELTDIHEKTLMKEKDILAARYKEKLGEVERHFQVQQKTFAEHSEKERSILIAQQKKRDEENSVVMEQTHVYFQTEIETLKKQQEIAKKKFEESLKKEWLIWADDYKKQQNANFTKTENAIRNNCQKERDKEIEIAITRLEKEFREMRTKLQQASDNKLRLITEEYDTKLQSAIESENMEKNKLLLLGKKLQCTEIQLEQTESKLKEYMYNLDNINKTITNLTTERDNAKKIARQELKIEKRELENKIASLYQEITQKDTNRDQVMALLHSRIRLIVTQKILTIKNLIKELNEANSKCEHLENLLDQQRKEYILKSL